MDISRPRVVVTGAAGRFGRIACEPLADAFDLVLTDLLASAERPGIVPLDLMDFAGLCDLMTGAEAVVHMAIASADACQHLSDQEFADETMKVNVIGTQHVFEAARQCGLKRIVYVSSMTTHLGLPMLDEITPQTPPRPRDLYAVSKLFGEQLAEQYARSHDLQVVCLRIGQPMSSDCRSTVSRGLLQDWRMRGILVHHDDLVQAIRCALTAQNFRYRLINVVSCSATPMASLAGAECIGYRPKYRFDETGVVPVSAVGVDQKTGVVPVSAVGVDQSPPKRLRLAAVVTEYRENSHADVILSRWLAPRETDAEWGWPAAASDIVAIYADQLPENDMAVEICRRYGVRLCQTVAEALTDEDGSLAVDGVLLIGEHGNYPKNELGQCLYPRKELFDRITSVFAGGNRSVPVFCDKQYSWNFDWAAAMYKTAWDLNFMLFGGSSLPHCRLQPPVELPPDAYAKHVVAVYYGGLESYGFHSIELAQSIVEQRRHGETGISCVTCWEGEEVWRQQDAGQWPSDLFEAAVAAVAEPVAAGDVRDNCPQVTAFQIVHRDGVRVTHINLTGHISGWGLALRPAPTDTILATTPVMGGADTHYAHFATLNRVIEDAFIAGVPPHPAARNLLTTGTIAAVMRARLTPGEVLPTRELMIPYRTGPCSYFGRAGR